MFSLRYYITLFLGGGGGGVGESLLKLLFLFMLESILVHNFKRSIVHFKTNSLPKKYTVETK
jgi:hypothetical protein